MNNEKENIYTENGYKDRRDYLENLATFYGLFIDEVETIAETLGENEDFDGLITSLIDYCAEYYEN